MQRGYRGPTTGLYDSQINLGTLMARTYLLLAATIGVSALASIYAMHSPAIYAHRFTLIIASLICLFAVRYTGGRNSPIAIPLVFAFAGCMGAMMGGEVSFYLARQGGASIISETLAATAGVFVVMSIYGMVSRRNFKHWLGFLITGLIVGILVSLVNVFFLHLAVVQLAVAGVMVLVFSGLIAYDTHRMVNGGIQQPVLLVVGLYLDIINLFSALLQIFGSRE